MNKKIILWSICYWIIQSACVHPFLSWCLRYHDKYNEEECQDLNARDLIAQKGAGKKVAIVGHFPFIAQLREVVNKLWVIEKNPREGDRTEAEAEDFIPQADVVGITGTAFTNHSIEQLLGLCNSKAYVIVLGDTAPLTRLLFDYHVDVIACR